MRGTIEERFFDKVFPEPNSGCWLWDGARSCGYGRFNKNGEIVPAHRFSFELHKNKIPDGMDVCHHCDNPCCVNPDHLFIGDHTQNMQDKVKKGRQKTKLSSNDVLEIRAKYSYNRITLEELGDEYGVNLVTIYDAVRNRTWRHV